DGVIGGGWVLAYRGRARRGGYALGEHTGEDTGRPARGKRHDDADRTIGIGPAVGACGLRPLLRGGRPHHQRRHHCKRDPTTVMASFSQSNLMPVSLITFSQRRASLRMKAENSSGVLVTG